MREIFQIISIRNHYMLSKQDIHFCKSGGFSLRIEPFWVKLAPFLTTSPLPTQSKWQVFPLPPLPLPPTQKGTFHNEIPSTSTWLLFPSISKDCAWEIVFSDYSWNKHSATLLFPETSREAIQQSSTKSSILLQNPDGRVGEQFGERFCRCPQHLLLYL